MTEINHADRAHAVLSASGASRWMACTPSAALEKNIPDQTSEFAMEGTAAHELSEIYLQYEIGEIVKGTRTRRINKFREHSTFYSQEMVDYVEKYVDIVVEKINEAKARSADAVILLEQRLDFSEWVPKGFGTGDVVIISDGVLEVVDLKYGKGVEVSAVDNPQLRLYGLGAYNQYEMLYDIEKVSMTIVQPRLDNVSTETLLASDLVAWAENEVKPKALMAWEGEGEFAPGEHCRFCKIRSTCRARADENLELAKYEFADPIELSAELGLDEIGKILLQAAELKKWVADIEKYALEQTEKYGKKIDGWKLVEGRSNRKYTDETKVFETLKEEEFKEDAIAPRKLLGITALEKELGKKVFTALLSEYIVKPPGKPTLVPESDKRPELNSADSAKEDFQ